MWNTGNSARFSRAVPIGPRRQFHPTPTDRLDNRAGRVYQTGFDSASNIECFTDRTVVTNRSYKGVHDIGDVHIVTRLVSG